ncbi:endoplasmic reticulum-golgi intermediate compartment protein [Anaeramoeba flamelloides]|uniref:Endoplasmic reticulum-golgi intermediate compartment protein n=1 Tax=Anaeramoeba flamelloides TaxID=1746091 RepID=A0AAV8ACP7_9EUKA|nr:endoplasmic reticulum-golgi intermediate compartment protein [Anaeramoeba flamelloides]
MKTLVKFDAYPKTEKQNRIQTVSGGAMTLISILLIMILFFNELNLYLSKHYQQNLKVDLSRGGGVSINIDLTLPRASCDSIHIDVLDVSGEHQLGLEKNLQLKTLDPNGKYYQPNSLNFNKDYCGSCYEAVPINENGCCNTCQDIRMAYQSMNKPFTDEMLSKFNQCLQEGIKTVSQLIEKDKKYNVGCHISGFLMINKVHGNFHLAPGRTIERNGRHMHDLSTAKNLMSLNLTHEIEMISFGELFPGSLNPLAGRTVTQPELGPYMYQYFVKIIPTVYYTDHKKENAIKTYQYSVYEYDKELASNHDNGLPGIYFSYDFSPIMVEIIQDRKSFFHFITQLFGLLGGIYAISSLLDNILFHFLLSLSKNDK